MRQEALDEHIRLRQAGFRRKASRAIGLAGLATLGSYIGLAAVVSEASVAEAVRRWLQSKRLYWAADWLSIRTQDGSLPFVPLLVALALLIGSFFLSLESPTAWQGSSIQRRLFALPKKNTQPTKPPPSSSSKPTTTSSSTSTPHSTPRFTPTKVSYTSPGDSSLYSNEKPFRGRRRVAQRYGSFSPGFSSPGFSSPGFSSPGFSTSSPMMDGSPAFNLVQHQRFDSPITPGRGRENVCSACSSPLMLTTPAETSQADSKAFALLYELPVEWERRSKKSVSDYIDDWADNITKTLSKYVHEHVFAALEKNTAALCEVPGGFFTKELLDNSLNQNGNGLETSKQRAMETLNAVLSQPQQGLFGGQQDNKKVQAQQAMSSLRRLLDERARIDKSLTLSTVPNSYPKGLILQRLKGLFGSSDKSIRMSEWSSPPYDQDIVVHIACDWLDRVLRIDDKQSSFAQYHLRDTSSPLAMLSPEASQNWWGLQRSLVANVPHYDVVVQGRLWNVRSGRHNALHSIVLLIYSMKLRRVVGVEAVEHLIGGNSYIS